MRISMSVKSQTVVKNLQNKEAQAVAQAQAVVSEAVTNVLLDSQERMPVKTGALRDSGKTEVKQEGYTIAGYVGFGDSSLNPDTGRTTASYAVEKHEDPENGKFLENAVYDAAESFVENLATALHRIF